MTVQFSDTLRSNMIGQIESTLSTSPKLILRTGAPPANCAAVDSGTFLAILTLPSDWVGAASAGTVTIANGPWTGTGAAGGTIGHYRLKTNAATSTDNTGVTHEQGNVSVSGGDLNLDNLVVATGQTINITSWTRAQGGG